MKITHRQPAPGPSHERDPDPAARRRQTKAVRRSRRFTELPSAAPRLTPALSVVGKRSGVNGERRAPDESSSWAPTISIGLWIRQALRLKVSVRSAAVCLHQPQHVRMFELRSTPFASGCRCGWSADGHSRAPADTLTDTIITPSPPRLDFGLARVRESYPINPDGKAILRRLRSL